MRPWKSKKALSVIALPPNIDGHLDTVHEHLRPDYTTSLPQSSRIDPSQSCQPITVYRRRPARVFTFAFFPLLLQPTAPADPSLPGSKGGASCLKPRWWWATPTALTTAATVSGGSKNEDLSPYLRRRRGRRHETTPARYLNLTLSLNYRRQRYLSRTQQRDFSTTSCPTTRAHASLRPCHPPVVPPPSPVADSTKVRSHSSP